MNAMAYGRKSINYADTINSRPSDMAITDKNNSELDDLKRIKLQNLTSLVNNPKRDTFFSKVGTAVKNKIDNNNKIHSKGYQ